MTLDSLIQFFYTTWLHNDFAIACVLGMIVSVGLLLKKPSRSGVLLFLSFLFLLIRFEYIKHFVEPLLDQTTGVLLQTGEQPGQERKLYLFFNVLIPFGLYVLGWGSMFVALTLQHWPRFQKSKKIDQK